MPTTSTHSPTFPFHTHIGLSLTGRLGVGGLVQLRRDGVEVATELPPALFDLLAILVREALRASETEAGPYQGFVSATWLIRQLNTLARDRSHALRFDRMHVNKSMYRLRKLFDGLLPGSVKSPELPTGGSLMEHRRYFGYRVSTPPEYLHLKLLEEE